MAKKITRQIGAYSRPSSMAKVDGRTRHGRFIAAVRKRLSDHVGGNPSATQAVLIELAALMSLRIALLSDVVLSAAAIEERDDRQLVAWINSLARLMDKLGLKGAASRPRSLADIFPGMHQ
jgi:hypothetical protein